MATTRKAAAKRRPAEKKAAQKSRPAPTARSAATKKPGVAQTLKQLDLTGVAGKLVEGRRKDLQAIVEANKKSYAGIQAVVQRQTAMLKEAIGQWQALAGSVSVAEPRESISKLNEMARASFQSSLGNIRELAELAGRSQAEAFEVLKARIQENVDEVNQMLKRG